MGTARDSFGGWSPAVVALFEECAAERQNKLRKDEYDTTHDTTTWSARTWLTFKTQNGSRWLSTERWRLSSQTRLGSAPPSIDVDAPYERRVGAWPVRVWLRGAGESG